MPISQFLLFADSEVAATVLANREVRISFSAAHILRQDVENYDNLIEGFARHVEIILSTAKIHQPPSECLGKISSGRFFMERKWLQQIPLPCTVAGPIKIDISFTNQSHLDFEADRLECRFTGEPNFFESMAC